MREPPTTWALRRLPSRHRKAAALVTGLLALPYVAAVVRARAVGWVPSGDAGMFGLFARDTIHGHPRLLSTPTTADLLTGVAPHHPGPIEFYGLALPMQVFGATLGMLVWTAFVNGISVLVAAWAAFRRLGPAGGLWAALVLGGVAWSQGPAQLVDPINSDAGAVPLFALVVLAWAVAAGDRRLLPLLALWSAYFCQLNLGYLPIGLAVTGLALAVALGPPAWTWTWTVALPGLVRRGPASVDEPTDEPGPDPGPVEPEPGPTDPGSVDLDDLWVPSGADVDRGGSVAVLERPVRVEVAEAVDPAAGEAVAPTPTPGRWWPWVLGAAAVSLVAWLPVLIDWLTNEPSNVGLIYAYVRLDDRGVVVEPTGAMGRVAQALGPVPLIARTDVVPHDFDAPVSLLGWIWTAAVLVGLDRIVRRRWRTARPIALLAGGTLFLTAVGLWVAAQVPIIYFNRMGYLRWTFVLSALLWTTVGAFAVHEVGGWLRDRRPVAHDCFLRPARAVAVALVAVVAVGSITVAGPRDGREDLLFDLENDLTDAATPAVEGEDTVLIMPFGSLSARSIAQPLALALEEEGHHVVIPAYEANNYGDHRRIAARRPDAVLLVYASVGPTESKAGKLVFEGSIDPDQPARIEALTRRLAAGPAVLSPDADAIAEAVGTDPIALRIDATALPATPEKLFRDVSRLRALQAGYLDSPTLDPRLLQAAIDGSSRSLWGADTIQVRLMTPAQFRRAFPGTT